MIDHPLRSVPGTGEICGAQVRWVIQGVNAMYFLIGMLLIGALLFALWRMTGPSDAVGGTRPGGSARPTPPSQRKPARREPLPPDDNPDFLRELDRRARREEDPPA